MLMNVPFCCFVVSRTIESSGIVDKKKLNCYTSKAYHTTKKQLLTAGKSEDEAAAGARAAYKKAKETYMNPVDID